MKHGTDNELNAVGTLVSQVIPVYEDVALFYEEGCYSLPTDRDPHLIIVSPDGSCRKDGIPVSAIEIKCPVLGKKYTPDVHYTIPDFVCVEVLRPSQPNESCRARSVYLTTRLLDRLSPLSG